MALEAGSVLPGAPSTACFFLLYRRCIAVVFFEITGKKKKPEMNNK